MDKILIIDDDKELCALIKQCMMPGIDGFETMEKIRSNSSVPI